MKKIVLSLFIVTFVLGCKKQDKQQEATAEPYKLQQTMYYGGDILTMEGEEPNYAEALVQREGKIIFLGSKAEALKKYIGKVTEVDLQGKTMVPGFIDGHAHFHGFGAQAVGANLLASPDGTCDNIDQLIESLKEWYAENGTNKSQGWIFGMGYDDAALKEGRHPTKEDLDKVSTEVPIMAIHISGHFSVVNSKALQMLEITADTKNSYGGVVRRMPGSQEPNGVLKN